MKLQLFIRNELLIENEIEMPEWKILLKSSHEKRQEILKLHIAKFKNKYAKVLENNEYEIFMSAESKMNELEEELPESVAKIKKEVKYKYVVKSFSDNLI